MDSKAPEIKRMLRAIPNFDLRTDLTSRGGNEGEAGRSDGVFVYYGTAGYIEFKDCEAGLSFTGKSGWGIHQRQWAWERVKRGTPYWLTLIAGKDRPDANKELLHPKRAWMIPFFYAEHCIRLITERCSQKSIPYRAEHGMRRILVDNKLDCVTLFGSHELKWEDGGWTLPDDHPFTYDLATIKDYLAENTWKDHVLPGYQKEFQLWASDYGREDNV